MTLALKLTETINCWEQGGNQNFISKTFKFESHRNAMKFVMKVGGICENLDHFPTIVIENKVVVIESTTNESLTEKDWKLAEAVDGNYKW